METVRFTSDHLCTRRPSLNRLFRINATLPIVMSSHSPIMSAVPASAKPNRRALLKETALAYINSSRSRPEDRRARTAFEQAGARGIVSRSEVDSRHRLPFAEDIRKPAFLAVPRGRKAAPRERRYREGPTPLPPPRMVPIDGPVDPDLQILPSVPPQKSFPGSPTPAPSTSMSDASSAVSHSGGSSNTAVLDLRKKRLRNKHTISEDYSDERRVRKRRLVALGAVFNAKSASARKPDTERQAVHYGLSDVKISSRSKMATGSEQVLGERIARPIAT
ncbi:hypothetical protein B0H66DRAFT_116334 [Apodospora peruviana]|uniref:Uncharacterized protein n=1 Tax=Apodospora peruviana TaxID=516989 RepID=A0AAE0MAE3_9PEZI|nr:hypothetical protein B0H66DRAFT_116334 [Apodospora peruviana]